MGRLTWKNPDGTWGLNNMDIREVPGKLYGAVCKLKDYEETGLTPQQMAEIDELYAEKCREAAKLKKELEKYHVIGTVEECREARGKQKAKKAIKKRFMPDGPLLDSCPLCGKYLSERHFANCSDCGQAIDWSE